MSSSGFDEAKVAFKAIAARLEGPAQRWTDGERLEHLQNIETLARILPALGHEHLDELTHASADELGGSLPRVLADRLRISVAEARRRIAEAADLGPRHSLLGEALAPKLAATAAAQRAGVIGDEHIKIIRDFFAQLPCFIDEPTREHAEEQLATVAAQRRPDELMRFARDLDLRLNPDGNFTDTDRARRRGFVIGPQGRDGMSYARGWVSPECRAGLDAVLAKWAAPGMCNPQTEHPVVNAKPSQDDMDHDFRSVAQRNHDALNMLVRHALTSGKLGSHQGLPVTIVATTTVAELHDKAGVAYTGGASVIPIPTLVRMAAQASNYLLVFDQTTKKCELYKGRSTRIATPEQRLVLYATERGCTHPGCDVPAYWCQGHHVNTDWAADGKTDIDNLTLACGPDNRKVKKGGWKTR